MTSLHDIERELPQDGFEWSCSLGRAGRNKFRTIRMVSFSASSSSPGFEGFYNPSWAKPVPRDGLFQFIAQGSQIL